MEDYRDFFPSEVFAVTTDREIDFSFPGDGEIFSKEQVRFLKERLQIDAGRVSNIRQVHGQRVVVANPEDVQEADAQITNRKGVALAVRTADCLPVFLLDRVRRAIGLVHAGWKGTRANIAAKTVLMMERQYATAAKDIVAVIGPGICAEHYEVGAEFQDYFPGQTRLKQGAVHLDLAAVNALQLTGAGVAAENVFHSKACTFDRPEYFSYRKEAGTAGRMLSVIMLRS